MSKTIQREMHFPQPREQVWQAITERVTLAEWMFPNDFEPRVGHRFTFQVPANPKVNFDGLTVHCEVLECEAPSQLVFSWSAGELVDTKVSFRLEPDGQGTKLLFEHAGFNITQAFGEQAFKGAEYGWARMLKQLMVVVTALVPKVWKRGDLVELDGLLAVVVAVDGDPNVPEDHIAVWFGDPRCVRRSQGGSGGMNAEVWTIPAEYFVVTAPPVWKH